MIQHAFGNHPLAMSLRRLATEFLENDTTPLLDFASLLSSKERDGTPFKPYIPFVGTRYNETKILLYATAQNLNPDDHPALLYRKNQERQVMRLWVESSSDPEQPYAKYPEQGFSRRCIDIRPFENGLLPGLVAMYLLARDGELNVPLDDVFHLCAVTNYFKASLRLSKNGIGGKDLNPSSLSDYHPNAEKWIDYHSALVARELDILEPNIVFSFRNPGFDFLVSRLGNRQVFRINDPAWILKSRGKTLHPGSMWYKRAEDYKTPQAAEIAREIAWNVDGGGYSGESRKPLFEVYLLKYFADFQERLNER